MRVWLDPEQAGLAQPDRQRRRPRPPAAERPGGRRPDRPAAGRHRAGVPVHHEHAGPAGRPRAVRRHHRQDATPTAALVRLQRRRPHRTGRPALRPDLHARRPALGGAVDLPVARLQRPGHRPSRSRPRWRSSRRAFPRASTTRSSTTRRPSSASRSTRCSRRLRDAVILVAIVVLVFLQNWRSAIIPLIAVPVAIIGTFAVMAALGFSLNNLSLFGLVLAIGIVVDDAIVVVETVEHHIEHGLSPRDATIKAMDEVTGPVIAIALVLCAVFVPCAFITGITGQFFRQFALTIAVSTVISAFNSLTLSPALAALLLRPRDKQRAAPLPWLAFVVAGGWLGCEFLTPWLHERGWFAIASAESLPWIAAGIGGRCGGLLSWPLNRVLWLAFRGVQPGVRLHGQRLHLVGRPAAARQPARAGRLRRPAVPDLCALQRDAHGLHPDAGQGLPAGQRATARLGLASAAPTRSMRADRRRSPWRRRASSTPWPSPASRSRWPPTRRTSARCSSCSTTFTSGTAPSMSADAIGRAAADDAADGNSRRHGHRLRRPAGRRPGHGRRLQADDRGPRRHAGSNALQSVADQLVAGRRARPGHQRSVHQLPRQHAPALPRHRPHRRQA